MWSGAVGPQAAKVGGRGAYDWLVADEAPCGFCIRKGGSLFQSPEGWVSPEVRGPGLPYIADLSSQLQPLYNTSIAYARLRRSVPVRRVWGGMGLLLQ